MKPVCRAPFSHRCEILRSLKSETPHSAVSSCSAFGNTHEVRLTVRLAGHKFEASKFGTRPPSSEGQVELLFCGEVMFGIVASKPFYAII